MIKYELVKELQDAGYPQPFSKTKYRKHGSRAYKFGIKGLKIIPSPTDKQYHQMMLVGLDVVYIPPLEELIKSCEGHKQFVLKYVEAYEENWRAFVSDTGVIEADGKTPEEAVAHLWLKLNK